MRAKKTSRTPTTIKVGGTYRERATGRSVTVVDHEVKRGGRTGLLIVETVDVVYHRRRLAVRPGALAELPSDEQYVPLLDVTRDRPAGAVPATSPTSLAGPAVAQDGTAEKDQGDESWIWGGP